MTKTEHYQLPQWEPADPVQRVDFNDAFAAVDKKCGNCVILEGSYVGTGEHGQDHPNVLEFDFYPKLIFLDTHYYDSNRPVILVNGCGQGTVHMNTDTNYVTWEGKKVSWYNTHDESRQYNYRNSTYHYIVLGVPG